MASISAKAARGHHTFALTVTETATSNTANTSTLSYALSITPTHSSYQWNGEGTNISYSVTINGSVVASGYIPDYNGATKNICSGTTTVTHNVGGAKSITIAFAVNDRDEESYTCGDASASGTMALTTISIASYTLSISAGTGSTITVNRTSSPKKGAATGNLSNGATVYYSDVLKISFGAGTNYDLGTHTVNGSTFTSGSSHTVTKAVSVVATATGKTYTITYNANGGSGTMANTTYTYATSGTVSLRENTFTRTGYTFLGWSLSSTATTASYTDGQNWNRSNGNNYTLYAVWKLNTYTLSISAGTGSTVTVDRTSSPKGGASTGSLNSGAIIYYSDVLNITFGAESGYEIETHTVNGSTFASGDSHTVTSAVVVVATAKQMGLVLVYGEASFQKYLIYIYNGADWDMYIPYVYDGAAWILCS